MSKIINKVLKIFNLNIGLNLATIISIILVLFKEPILYFFQYYNIRFIKNIEPIVDSVTLGVISSYVFYYFTVYRPEKKKKQQIEKQILSNINDLKNILFEYTNHLETLKAFKEKRSSYFNKMHKGCIEFEKMNLEDIMKQNMTESILLMESKENLIDCYLYNMSLLNNLYINNEQLNIAINSYNETKFKKRPYRTNIPAIVGYHKSILYAIKDIVKICDEENILS